MKKDFDMKPIIDLMHNAIEGLNKIPKSKNRKTYSVLLLDKDTNEFDSKGTFHADQEELQSRLIELQKAHLEGKFDKPTINIREVTSNNRRLEVMFAESKSNKAFISVLRQLN